MAKNEQPEFTAQTLREATWEALRKKDPGIETLYKEVTRGIMDAVAKGEYTASLASHITNLKRMEAVLYRLHGLDLQGYIERDHPMQSISLTLSWGQV